MVDSVDGSKNALALMLEGLSGLSNQTPAATGSGGPAQLPPSANTADNLGGLAQLPILPSPLRSLAGVSLETLVEALGGEERKVAVKNGLETLEAKAKDQKETNEKKLQELIEQVEKMKAKGILAIFMKIFKFLALIVGAIAAAVTTAAGVLTGNPLLVAAGVLMATLTVDGIMSEASDGQVSLAAGVEALAKACGADDETAKWVSFGFTMAATVASIALSFGAAFASGAGKVTTEVATKVMKELTDLKTLTSFAGGVMSVGTGAGTVGEAVLDWQIAQKQANTKELEAILERLRTAMETEQDFLKIVMEKFQDLSGKLQDIITDNNNAQAAILGGGQVAGGQMA